MTDEQPNNTARYPALLGAVGEFFREHPAVAGSLLYLQVTTVGVVYSWALFRRFDINIFDYAEINDFLLAAFKDPRVFALSIGSFFAFISLGVVNWWRLRMTHIIEARARSDLVQIILTWIIVIAAVPYSLFLPFFWANNTADSMLLPKYKPLTSVQYRATSNSDEQTTETALRVIGTTQSFVFFYDKQNERTLVIPTAQIVEMQHDRPKGEPKEKR